MKCPCCQNEMNLMYTHSVFGIPEVDERTYHISVCLAGSQYCNGLVTKHDLNDQKITFITPCHTTTTLHINFINSVSSDDLLKAIFTTYEWCAHKGIDQ